MYFSGALRRTVEEEASLFILLIQSSTTEPFSALEKTPLAGDDDIDFDDDDDDDDDNHDDANDVDNKICIRG